MKDFVQIHFLNHSLVDILHLAGAGSASAVTTAVAAAISESFGKLERNLLVKIGTEVQIEVKKIGEEIASKLERFAD